MIVNGLDGRMFFAGLHVTKLFTKAYVSHEIEAEEVGPIGCVDWLSDTFIEFLEKDVYFPLYARLVGHYSCNL